MVMAVFAAEIDLDEDIPSAKGMTEEEKIQVADIYCEKFARHLLSKMTDKELAQL